MAPEPTTTNLPLLPGKKKRIATENIEKTLITGCQNRDARQAPQAYYNLIGKKVGLQYKLPMYGPEGHILK